MNHGGRAGRALDVAPKDVIIRFRKCPSPGPDNVLRLHVLHTAALLAAAAVPVALGAQAPAPPTHSSGDSTAALATRGPVRALSTIGSRAEERTRDDQLRGNASDAGWLMRSPSSLTPWSATRGAASVVAPEIAVGWNSAIPVARNDGSLRGGRGAETRVMTGVMLQGGPLRLIVAPEIVYAQNRAFEDVLPDTWSDSQRVTYRAPWLAGRNSADLPYRFGGASETRVLPGQSSLTLRGGLLAVGAATESQWWGPGVRNAILFTNQAPGIPHLFARTARPVRTPLGALELKWVAGALERSEWADSSQARWRSLSAAGLVLHPAFAPGLSLGAARSVYAEADGGMGSTLSNAADVFVRWRAAGNVANPDPFEQMTSLFGRWVFPSAGAEVYAEWARYRFPSLRQLMETPENSQGYVFGGQWLRPAGRSAVRLQTEFTFLERSPASFANPSRSWYASAAVPGGYTNQGEGIGSAVGPGGSGQWIAGDWLRGDTRIGVFLGRVRWANDAYYDYPGSLLSRYRGHDVTGYGGARAAAALGALSFDLEYSVGKRYNYLFQSRAGDWDQRDNTRNVVNSSLQLRVTARP